MNGGDWFYLESGQQRGPVALDTLVGILRTLPSGTLVWRDGLADWMKAEEVPELGARLVPPPPRPASAAASAFGLGTPPPEAGRPAASRPMARPTTAAPRPALRPAAAAPRSALGTAPRPDGEPETRNPLVLFGRCFQWNGRFTRAEYAMATFGGLVVGFGIIFGGALLSVLSGAGSDGSSTLVGGIGMVVGLALTALLLGAGVRRFHDLGQSGFLAGGLLVPCLSFFVMIYLLFAPGLSDTPGKGIPGVVIAGALLLLSVPFLGIFSAIAIPSLLRARVSANESAAIGDIRAVISAQEAYQAMNGGYYESRLECLARPGDCIPNSTAEPTVMAAIVASPKQGYVRELVTGPRVSGLPAGISRTSATSYAFVAHPVTAGQTGVRSFCGDGSGRICFDVGGRADLAEREGDEVRCSERCPSLR